MAVFMAVFMAVSGGGRVAVGTMDCSDEEVRPIRAEENPGWRSQFGHVPSVTTCPLASGGYQDARRRHPDQ